MKVNLARTEAFTLKIRIPYWTKNPTIIVNGKKIEGAVPGTYLDIHRTWNGAEKLEINFPMRCQLIDAPHGSNRAGDNFQALKYGPIVLARDENIDRHYADSVHIVADKEGNVKIKPVSPTLTSTRMEFMVPTSEGKIHMVDYASVNCWGGLHVCTWLPRK